MPRVANGSPRWAPHLQGNGPHVATVVQGPQTLQRISEESGAQLEGYIVRAAVADTDAAAELLGRAQALQLWDNRPVLW